MARHYSIRSFFRQIPKALLARYFAAKGLLADFDFAALRATRLDGLMEAWDSLSDEVRTAVEADFREIFEMSCDNGLRAIIAEAKWHLAHASDPYAQDPEAPSDALGAFEAKLRALPCHFERAMVTFLDHQDLWYGATHFCHADRLRYWRKSKDLPKVAPAVDKESLRKLEAAIRAHFKATEWRGRYCVVEVLSRGDYEYFFVYLEDYPRKDPEWLAGELTPRRHIPATEIVFVYNPKEGTLDLSARGSSKALVPLQDIFAKIILRGGKAAPASTGLVYNLNALRRRHFNFVIAPGSPIEDVRLRMLKLSSLAVRGDRITLEADSRRNPAAVHDLLARLEACTPLLSYEVTHVELAATVRTGTGKTRTVPVRIACPNACSLKHEDVDGALRAMLQASGIESREQNLQPSLFDLEAAASAPAEA